MSEQIGLIFFFSATVLSVLIVLICSFRQHVINLNSSSDSCWGKIFCRGRRPESEEGEHSEQYYADRVLAESLQRRINEEEREQERLVKRKERRMWYEYYMKPCTMVVEKSNLFYAKGDGSPIEDEPVDDTKIELQTEKQQTSKDEFMDSDAEEIGENFKKPIVSDEDDENAALYLKLSAPGCSVDGTCALCIDEYDVGDNVVWSDLQCPHAFHKECLMQWLSKGKKRCPICRHWFVPGTKIDDQKRVHGEAWQRALSEMEQRQKEEKLIQARKKVEAEVAKLMKQKRMVETIRTDELPTGENKFSELPNTKSRDPELELTILRNDSRDSEHGGYNSSGFETEIVDIESQQTIPKKKGTETFRAHNMNGSDFKNSGEAQEQNENSMKSEDHIADEYTQV